MAVTEPSIALPAARPLAEAFSGAPLDIIKTVAAISMTVDHTSKILFGYKSFTCWYIGRAAFPLFVFAIAVHLLRGVRPWPFVQRLLLLAVVSQPAYSLAFCSWDADTVFTLAVGATMAVLLVARSPPTRQLSLAIVAIALFQPWLPISLGLDFGLGGIILPAALVLALGGGREYFPWLALVVVALSRYPHVWLMDEVIAFASIILGGGGVVLGSLLWRGRPRFLPRYAFYVFYPGHLLLLALLKAVWLS